MASTSILCSILNPPLMFQLYHCCPPYNFLQYNSPVSALHLQSGLWHQWFTHSPGLPYGPSLHNILAAKAGNEGRMDIYYLVSVGSYKTWTVSLKILPAPLVPHPSFKFLNKYPAIFFIAVSLDL